MHNGGLVCLQYCQRGSDPPKRKTGCTRYSNGDLMRPILSRVGVTGLAACVLALGGTAAASGAVAAATHNTQVPAAANDLAGASATWSLDVSRASVNNANQTAADPNTTCQVTTTGDALVQSTDALVAQVYGEDFGAASGTCLSFDTTTTYNATVTVSLEAFYPDRPGALTGTWKVISTSPPESTNSLQGLAEPLPTYLIQRYGLNDPSLNRYHRAHGIITDTRGQRFESYSPYWFMNP
jgi:hypothetical protein